MTSHVSLTAVSSALRSGGAAASTIHRVCFFLNLFVDVGDDKMPYLYMDQDASVEMLETPHSLSRYAYLTQPPSKDFR